MTDPLKRMAIASCGGTPGMCFCAPKYDPLRKECLARAKRCWDATLPLSDEMVLAWDLAEPGEPELEGGGYSPRQCAEAHVAAMARAARGES